MPKDKKKVTKTKVEKAISLFNRALMLQRDLYDFRNVLKDEMRLEDLAQQLEDGAFEMDLTWNNAEKVYKELFELYKKQ